MKQRLSFVFVLAILICVAAPIASAADVNDDVNVFVDNERIDENGRSFISDGVTYVPLVELCEFLGAESMSWDRSQDKATVKAPDLEFTVEEGVDYIEANGRLIPAENAYVDVEGVLMVPVRPVCQAFGAEVSWDGDTNSVYITSTGKPIESGDTYYDEDDLYWLSRIIYAEAGGECLEGKIAVGNVIMNRVASDLFPDTIYEVIFDRSCGIQFSPAYSGSIYRTPNEESVLAAKLVLDGVVVTEKALYFTPNRSAATSWAGKNRPYDTQIGGHTFFA